MSNHLLNKNTDGNGRNEDSFYCRSDIGYRSCLAGCTTPDVSMAVHQATKLSTDPKSCHDTAVKRIGKHPLGAAEDVLTHEPYDAKGLEIFIDADFSGGFDKANAEDPELACSSTGFIIKCAGFPIT